MNSTNSTKKLSKKEMMKEQADSLAKLFSHLKLDIGKFNKFEDKSKSENEQMVAKVQARVDKDKADLKKANLTAFERELLQNRTQTDERELQYWTRGRKIQHSMFHA